MKKNMTADQKKAARAAYAKAYYEKLKAAKAEKAGKADKAKKTAKNEKAIKKTAKKAVAKKTEVKKANVKKAAKKTNVKKTNVRKAAKKIEVKKAVKAAVKNVNAKKTVQKFSMKPAQKLFDQVKKPLSNVRKLTKAYGKLISETLKANDANAVDRVSKLFSYAGFKFDKDNGVVTISINGKVKVPAAKKIDVAKVDVVKPAKKRGRKPKAVVAAAEPAVELAAEPAEPAEPAAEPAPELVEEVMPTDIPTEGTGDPEEDEDEPEDTSRDRDVGEIGEEGERDYGEALNETEEAMRENGDWEN